MDNNEIFRSLGLVFMVEHLWSLEMQQWLGALEREFLRQRINKGNGIFYVGCGTGRNLIFLSGLASRVRTIDSSQIMVKLSKNVIKDAGLENVPIDRADIRFYDFGMHFFHADWFVFLWNTLGDINHTFYNRILKDLWRVCSRGIIISSWKEGEEVMQHRQKYYQRCGVTDLTSNGLDNDDFDRISGKCFGLDFFAHGLGGPKFLGLAEKACPKAKIELNELNQVGAIIEIRK